MLKQQFSNVYIFKEISDLSTRHKFKTTRPAMTNSTGTAANSTVGFDVDALLLLLEVFGLVFGLFWFILSIFSRFP